MRMALWNCYCMSCEAVYNSPVDTLSLTNALVQLLLTWDDFSSFLPQETVGNV